MGAFIGKHTFDEKWLRAAKNGTLSNLASQDTRFLAILELPDFERFVYVLTVLEGFTDRQCGMLLNVSPKQIEEARLQALQHFWKRD
jgi:DNA-directed RNA polymerase specialized sigma24 family protein